MVSPLLMWWTIRHVVAVGGPFFYLKAGAKILVDYWMY